MKATAMLEALEDAATRLAVRVSYEALATMVGHHGGLCRVRGEYRVIIDKRATTEERVATLGNSLARIDTSSVTVPPAVRQLIEFYSDRSSPRPAAARPAAARPGTTRAAAPVRRAS